LKILEKDLLFSYTNNRTYVHSSSIIECIWLSVKSYFSSYSNQYIFIDIRFHQILTSNAKIIVFDTYQDYSKDSLLASEGVLYTNDTKLYFYLFKNEVDIIINNEYFDYSVQIDANKNYGGSCLIGAIDIPSYLKNVIEANKKAHLLTFNSNKKLTILNLYMKKFPINTPYNNVEKINLHIENFGVKEHIKDIVTLNKIKIVEFDDIQFDIAYLVKQKNNE